MIVVTGATGKLGQAITERLLEKLPASQLGISVRDPKKAEALAERGVRVRQGDFKDPASLRHAFEGASQVLIISSNSSGDDAVEHHRTAIEAAKAIGAGRILYTSHMGSNPQSLFPPMRDHAATEALLQASGVPFTSLRNGFYVDSGIMLMGQALETGKLAAPEDGSVSWTTHADLSEAATIALTEEGRLAGITPPLTSTEIFDLSDIAAIASELTGREITRVITKEEEYRAGMISHKVSEPQADLLMGLFAASRQGEFSAVDPTLTHLLGRSPMTIRDGLATRLSS
ncbi:MAG: SDR family oxidoreductase [Nostoc sp. DedQUE01]